MREPDLPQVLALESAAYTMPWSEEAFRGLLRRRDCDLLVQEADREIVGYAVFWAVLDQGELGNIAVAEAWRRRGLATRLIEAVERCARERGVVEVFLEVRVSNAGAQELYNRHGFRQVGRRRDYYSAPVEDALVMCKRLES